MLKIEAAHAALTFAAITMNGVMAYVAVARPDLIGVLHYGAFSLASGGLLAVVFHKPSEPGAIRRMSAGTLLSGFVGTAFGVGYSEWTHHGNIALLVAIAAACATVSAISGRDVLALLERFLKIWRNKE